MSKCNERLLGFKSRSLLVLPVLLFCCWISAIANDHGSGTKSSSSELKSVVFVVEKPGEVGAAILVSLDQREQQDILLFAGDQSFKYRIALGRLEQGQHKIIISVNRERSAPRAAGAEILAVKPVFAGTD